MKRTLFTVNAVLFAILLFSSANAFSQESNCNSCSGYGYQSCIRCSGQGTYTCFNCDGNGGRWEACTQSSCNNGTVTMPDGSTETCLNCSGNGKVWHSCFNPLCSNGIVSCNFCGGDGSLMCPTCKGSGKN